MKIKVLMVGVGLFLISATAQANVVFDGGFETGNYSQWSEVEWNMARPLNEQFEIVTDIVRDGNYAAKMTVHDGDEFMHTGGERVQLERPDAYNEGEGDEYWYSWSTYFPSNWQNLTHAPDDWMVIADWHASNNVDFGNVCQPLQIEVDGNNRLIATMLSGDVTGYNCFNGAGTANYYDQVIVDSLNLGKWNDFVIHVKWTVEDDGIVEIWHKTDNEDSFTKVFEKTGVPTRQYVNTKSNADTPYFILAHYRSEEQAHTSVLYHDGFKQATSLSDFSRRKNICETSLTMSNCNNTQNVDSFVPTVKLKHSHKKYKLDKRKRLYLKRKKVSFRSQDGELAGGKVQLFVDGDLKEEDNVDSSGKWKISRKFKKNGNYKIRFKYFDEGDNFIGESSRYKIKIDTKKPKFIDNTTHLTRHAGDKIFFRATDTKSKKLKSKKRHKIKYYKYKFLGKKHKTKNPWFVIPASTPKGTHLLEVKAYDKAGNKVRQIIKVKIL